MASPRVMASASTSARSDQSPLYPVGHLAGDRRGGSLGSMNMEELLRNFYADTPAGGEIAAGGEKDGGGVGDGGGGEVAPPRQEGYSAAPRAAGVKTAEEVWKEISRERKVESEPEYKEEGFGEITLEAFLARAGAVTEEEVRGAPVAVQPRLEGPVLGFVVDPALPEGYAAPQQQQHILHVDASLAGFGGVVESSAGARGKRKQVEEPEDRATQQKQRRMIKNRESAARSRERKQAYILELEASVTRLEEENARLVRELEQQEKARLKQVPYCTIQWLFVKGIFPLAHGKPSSCRGGEETTTQPQENVLRAMVGGGERKPHPMLLSAPCTIERGGSGCPRKKKKM
ncbi:hypothetical protein Taro_017716 [Colocasia esculenta]|uniref:BZIP domain-containing protein n=1 Tax=Colocasia esculenta TaxID=4460 RepID=A0A843UNU8_COLES|nr:hypothetical protein [Colocasia esculenta]